MKSKYVSEKLLDGQTLKVRAIGDGVKSSTSEWSNTVTYEKPKHECVFSDEYQSDDEYHWKECSCGEIDKKEAHSGGSATTTKQAKCEVCGALYGELKLSGKSM